MSYIDGFVIPVPKKKLDYYKKMASDGGKIWMKHGAVQYFETVADDVKKQKWASISFPMTVKCKPTETVILSFIVFKSRKHRDQVNAKVMKDPAMNEQNFEIPFDMKRMVYGGFETIVEVS